MKRKIIKKYFSEFNLNLTPLEVKVKDNNFEEAFKQFKSLFQKEKMISQLKEKQAYEKPSAKKRRKKRQAYERKLALEAREQLIATGEWDKRQKQKQRKRQQKLERRLRQQEQSE